MKAHSHLDIGDFQELFYETQDRVYYYNQSMENIFYEMKPKASLVFSTMENICEAGKCSKSMIKLHESLVLESPYSFPGLFPFLFRCIGRLCNAFLDCCVYSMEIDERGTSLSYSHSFFPASVG
jgi:hypothetical protein